MKEGDEGKEWRDAARPHQADLPASRYSLTPASQMHVMQNENQDESPAGQ